MSCAESSLQSKINLYDASSSRLIATDKGVQVVSIIRIWREKLKGLLPESWGFRNYADFRVVRFKLLEMIVKQRHEIQNTEHLRLIQKVAAKVGLINQESVEMQSLVDLIGKSILGESQEEELAEERCQVILRRYQQRHPDLLRLYSPTIIAEIIVVSKPILTPVIPEKRQEPIVDDEPSLLQKEKLGKDLVSQDDEQENDPDAPLDQPLHQQMSTSQNQEQEKDPQGQNQEVLVEDTVFVEFPPTIQQPLPVFREVMSPLPGDEKKGIQEPQAPPLQEEAPLGRVNFEMPVIRSSSALWDPLPIKKVIDRVFSNPKWEDRKYGAVLKALATHLQDKVLDASDSSWNTDLGQQCQIMLYELRKSFPGACERDNYRNFINGLRAVLRSDAYRDELTKKRLKEKYNPLVDLVLYVCLVKFTGWEAYEFCERLVEKFLLEVTNEDSQLHQTDFSAIESASAERMSYWKVGVKKVLSNAKIGFDPDYLGNIPHKFYDVKVGEKTVSVFRTGTPTIEAGLGARITPEFRGYLQGLQFENKKHLYISLQNSKYKWKQWSDESSRHRALVELQKDFPETFNFVALAQDSDFYKQKGKADNQKIDQFIDEFLAEMLSDDSKRGFYFPVEWKESTKFTEQLKELLHHVKDVIYPDKTILSKDERFAFIEIYYAYLSLFLMKHSDADFSNISCKDAIDRAGKLNSLVFLLMKIIDGQWDDPDTKRMHRVWTHAPALFVKSQAILHGRRKMLMLAYEQLMKPEVLKRIADNCSSKVFWIY